MSFLLLSPALQCKVRLTSDFLEKSRRSREEDEKKTRSPGDEETTMAQSSALIPNVSMVSDVSGGVRPRSKVHPLLAAIENAPLEPISDEENAQLDEVLHSTTNWLTDEEFMSSVGLE